MQVQLTLTERETKILFVNTLLVLYYEKLVGSATKSFTDMVISNEMIENTMKSGKLDAEEKKIGTMRKKEGET